MTRNGLQENNRLILNITQEVSLFKEKVWFNPINVRFEPAMT